jgi:hypothetical protein
MMGCALIQPLMYFQLLNVPMFNGAYIIHKVTHSIASNTMKTKFVGTRVSKISPNIVEHSIHFLRRTLKRKEEALQEGFYAQIINDCPYTFYNPIDVNEQVPTFNSVFDAISKSFHNIKGKSDIEIGYSINDMQDEMYIYTHETFDTMQEDNALLFDVILQTYYEYINIVRWISSDRNTFPLYVSVKLSSNRENGKCVQCGMMNPNFEIHKGYEGLNKSFYLSLIKRYSIDKQNVDNAFKIDCKNFATLLTYENEWKEKVCNFFFKENNITKDVIIQDCKNVIKESIDNMIKNGEIPTGYQFDGDGIGAKEPSEKTKNQLQNLIVSTMKETGKNEQDSVEYLIEKALEVMGNSTTKGQCAKYVRKGLIKCGITADEVPNSACKYEAFLRYWGWKQVFYGKMSEYELTNSYHHGDIVVTAGLDSGGDNVHGHIQMYNAKANKEKWYCDKKYFNADVYRHNGERVSFLFRWPISSDEKLS